MEYACPKCKDKKHIRDQDGLWERCDCLIEEMAAQQHKVMKGVVPFPEPSHLAVHLKKTILIQSFRHHMGLFNRHLARILVDHCPLKVLGRGLESLLQDKLKDTMGAYAKAHSVDLLIITMFSAVENKYVPRMLNALIRDRESKEKGTWLIWDSWELDRNLIFGVFDPEKQHSDANSHLKEVLKNADVVQL